MFIFHQDLPFIPYITRDLSLHHRPQRLTAICVCIRYSFSVVYSLPTSLVSVSSSGFADLVYPIYTLLVIKQ